MTDIDKARQAIKIYLDTFEICSVNQQALELALTLPGKDFEDNLQTACADLLGLDAVVTRNTKDFTDAPISVFTPVEILAQLDLTPK